MKNKQILIFLFILISSFILDSVQLKNNLNDGIILNLPFDGDTKDYSGYNHNGTPGDVIFTEDRFSNKNGALFFKGIPNSKITIPGKDFNLNNFTIAVWIKSDETTGFARIFDKYDWTEKNGYGFNIMTPQYNRVFFSEYFDMSNTQIQLVSKETIRKNWQMVVFTFNGKTSKIYYNGILNVQKDNTQMGINHNQKNVTIGSNYDDDFYPFKGSMDDLLYWSRTLNEQEVKDLYEQTKPSENASNNPFNAINIDNQFTNNFNRKIQRLEKISGILQWVVCEYPWVTLNGKGDKKFQYYAFTVKPGSRAVFDIDNGIKERSGADNADIKIVLWDDKGNTLGGNDNIKDFSWFFNDPDKGSENDKNGLDSYFEWTFKQGGTYIIGAGVTDSKADNNGYNPSGNGLKPENTFILNIAVENHANTQPDNNNNKDNMKFEGGN